MIHLAAIVALALLAFSQSFAYARPESARRGGDIGRNDVGLPTGVILASLSATRTTSGVEVGWRTVSEVYVAGFNVWRSTQPTGGYAKLNAALIPPQNPGGIGGADYTYLDDAAPRGQTYYYRLEATRNDGGSEWAGPVAVGDGVYLPLVVR